MIRLPPVVMGTAALMLQACVFSPGMHMNTDRLLSKDSAENSMVEMVQITPKLLAQNHAVSSQVEVPQALLEYSPENYRIGANDSLFITVWDHPELTVPSGQQQSNEANARVVRDDGTLFYPFIGNVEVAGKTLEELRDILTSRLARFIEEPQVDVSVIGYNSQKIYLSGAFKNTGIIPVNAQQLTLLQAIGQAGIDLGKADLSSLTLIRDGKSYRLDYDRLITNPSRIGEVYLKPEDKIHMGLNDSRKVFVMGETPRPSALPYNTSRLTLTEVLGSVGGINSLTASGKEVYVIRGVSNIETEKAKVYQLNARSPSALLLASNFEMQPHDVVFIGAAQIVRWNRFISNLFPSASFLNVTLEAEDDLSNRN